MSKLQSILCLLVFLIIVFSMDMIFGNPLRETFRGGGGGGGRGLGLGLGNRVLINRNINTSGFVAADAPPYYFEQSDDEPFFFNWFRTI